MRLDEVEHLPKAKIVYKTAIQAYKLTLKCPNELCEEQFEDVILINRYDRTICPYCRSRVQINLDEEN